MLPVVLASGSTRRRELLKQITPDFTVISTDIDETPLPNEDAVTLCRRLALEKARAGFKPNTLTIGSDTMVTLGGKLYGKPRDAAENAAFLREFSGKTQELITAWCVKTDAVELVEHDITLLTFRDISEDEIQHFVTHSPRLDCAGGYAVQEEASAFVARIEGDILTIVGFPVEKIRKTLSDADSSSIPPRAYC